MKTFAQTLILLALLIGGTSAIWSQQAPPASSPADSPTGAGERVVISVGEEKITAADIEKILDVLPAQYRSFYSGQGKNLLPQYLVRMKILAAEALKQNLQAQPRVQLAATVARESILAEAAGKQIEQSISVSDEQLQALYQQRKAEFEEVRIRRILLRTDSSALGQSVSPQRPPLPAAEARKKLEDLRKQILAGADFAELAQANSDDLTTAGVGGDLGYINRQKVVPPVADASYNLRSGQVSDVIETPYGYELIKVEDKRTKPLNEVRPMLEAQIRQPKFEEIFKELAKKYRVEVDAQFFTAPAPGQPAPGGKPR